MKQNRRVLLNSLSLTMLLLAACVTLWPGSSPASAKIMIPPFPGSANVPGYELEMPDSIHKATLSISFSDKPGAVPFSELQARLRSEVPGKAEALIRYMETALSENGKIKPSDKVLLDTAGVLITPDANYIKPLNWDAVKTLQHSNFDCMLCTKSGELGDYWCLRPCEFLPPPDGNEK